MSGMDRRFSVAPMMEWTDRHCRYFLRGFSPRVLLYTEMITAEALLRGDAARLLQYSPEEQPLALQLGGSAPARLAAAARLGEQAGYREINLNCGCPSDRVHAGAFGAWAPIAFAVIRIVKPNPVMNALNGKSGSPRNTRCRVMSNRNRDIPGVSEHCIARIAR